MRYWFLPTLGALLCANGIAQAQQVGVYEGTTADGSSVSITVAQDPNNTNLEVKVLSVDFSLDCGKSGETIHSVGLGLGDGKDIVAGKFSYASSDFFDIDLVTSMTFHAQDTVKGKIGADVAAFNPAIGHDKLSKSTQACGAPNQTFEARFTGPQKYDIPAGAALIENHPQTAR